jgi:hypothetical protein
MKKVTDLDDFDISFKRLQLPEIFLSLYFNINTEKSIIMADHGGNPPFTCILGKGNQRVKRIRHYKRMRYKGKFDYKLRK